MSEETLNSEAAATAPEPEITANSEPAETGTPDEAEPQEPKTFTQEELDKIVSERLAKSERRLRREMAQQAEEAQRQAQRTPPDPNDYEDVGSYADALADHKAELILAQREQQKQQTAVRSTYEEREDAARAKYSDFEKVVYNPEALFTPDMVDAMMESEFGPEIAYHLGTNISELNRIRRMSPHSQAREIGRLEATLSTNPPPAKKVSSAPEPIKPVGTRAATPTYDTTDPRSIKSMSDSEWIEAERRRQMKKLRAQQG